MRLRVAFLKTLIQAFANLWHHQGIIPSWCLRSAKASIKVYNRQLNASLEQILKWAISIRAVNECKNSGNFIINDLKFQIVGCLHATNIYLEGPWRKLWLCLGKEDANKIFVWKWRNSDGAGKGLRSYSRNKYMYFWHYGFH